MGNSKEGTVWAVPAGKLASASTKLWNELGNRGGSVVVKLDEDPSFRKRTVEFLLRGGIESSAHIQLVRALMGNERIWGVEEWTSFYNVRFTKKQLHAVEKFPWSQDVLNAPCPFVKDKLVRETHFARLGLEKLNGIPLTILEWQRLHPAGGEPHFYSYAPSSWYASQGFATKVTCRFRWYLDLREVIPDSESSTYERQLKMVPPEYEVMTAIGNVAKDLHVYRKQGSYPNPNRYGRCTDAISGSDRVDVGDSAYDGLHVNVWPDDGPDSGVGLSVSRKFPS